MSLVGSVARGWEVAAVTGLLPCGAVHFEADEYSRLPLLSNIAWGYYVHQADEGNTYRQ